MKRTLRAGLVVIFSLVISAPALADTITDVSLHTKGVFFHAQVNPQQDGSVEFLVQYASDGNGTTAIVKGSASSSSQDAAYASIVGAVSVAIGGIAPQSAGPVVSSQVGTEVSYSFQNVKPASVKPPGDVSVSIIQEAVSVARNAGGFHAGELAGKLSATLTGVVNCPQCGYMAILSVDGINQNFDLNHWVYTVYSPDGQPVAGAVVTICFKTPDNSIATQDYTTNADGVAFTLVLTTSKILNTAITIGNVVCGDPTCGGNVGGIGH